MAHILAIVLAGGIGNCFQDDIDYSKLPPVSAGDVTDCHRDAMHDTTSVAHALLGTWYWQYVSCVSLIGEDGRSYDANRGLSLVFHEDHMVDLLRGWSHYREFFLARR